MFNQHPLSIVGVSILMELLLLTVSVHGLVWTTSESKFSKRQKMIKLVTATWGSIMLITLLYSHMKIWNSHPEFSEWLCSTVELEISSSMLIKFVNVVLVYFYVLFLIEEPLNHSSDQEDYNKNYDNSRPQIIYLSLILIVDCIILIVLSPLIILNLILSCIFILPYAYLIIPLVSLFYMTRIIIIRVRPDSLKFIQDISGLLEIDQNPFELINEILDDTRLGVNQYIICPRSSRIIYESLKILVIYVIWRIGLIILIPGISYSWIGLCDSKSYVESLSFGVDERPSIYEYTADTIDYIRLF
jgi:hypothetical protein